MPEVANLATIETCFALIAGMVGSATRFAVFFIATLRTGTSVSFLVFGVISVGNFTVTPLTVAVSGGVPFFR